MIKSIELENWKAHGRTSMRFSRGTNILVGQMGAGKSSILDAVSFALFGTFPAIKNRRIKIDDVIRSKPTRQRTARLRLDFDADGDSYTVERTISLDGSAKATLKKNGAYVQSQPQRVTEEIEKALKADYDLFSRAVYSEQNRLDYFLELSSSERKKQIDNLLGLDRFAAAQENATSLSNRIKGMVDDAEKLLRSFDVNKIKERMARISAEIAKLSEDENAAEKKATGLRADAVKLEKELSVLKSALSRRITLDREAAELRSRISALDKEIATVDAKRLQDPVEAARLVHNSEELIAKLKKDAAKSHDTLQSLQARLGSLQREVSDTGKRIKERDELLARAKGKDPEQMKKAIDECAKEIEAVDRDYAHANMLKHDAEKSFAELEKHTAKCPVCDSLLTKEKRESLMSSRKAVAEESSASMARLFKLRLEKRAMMDKLNSERNDIEVVLKSLEKYSGIEEQHRAALSMSDTVSREQSAAKALYDQANARLSEENENLSRLRIARETSERMRKHMSERDKFSEMLHAKSQELSGITVDDAAVEMLQLRHTRLMSELARQNAIMESSRKARNEKEEQARDTRGELSRASAILEELRAKKASIGDISRFKNALADTQSLLRARLVSSINETMHAIWPELYPYGDYTGAMLAASDSDYELRLRAVRDGEPVWESANAIASGGERSIACMAMRIAFSLVLVPNLRWLILDEPTHNIDSQGLSRFVSVLNEVLPSMVEQVFVITHDEQLKQVPNGRIYVLSRDKSEHEPASVSEL